MFLVDLEKQAVQQPVVWDSADIDWQGHGRDRGLRGIAFDGERVFIAASDELLAYSPDFRKIDTWRNPYLKHCDEIFVWERTLYLASAAFDTILGFHLDEHRFHWAMHVTGSRSRFKATLFDPLTDDGPLMVNKFHLNNVYCSRHGMYLTGLRTGGMLHFNGRSVRMAVELPAGTHNARPFRDGVLFNDTEADALRYTGRGEGEEDRAMTVPVFDESALIMPDSAKDELARQGYARGLCVLSDSVVAGGSSPATITVYDLAGNAVLGSVNLSKDVRHSIHGLECWPFD
ncbi:MAG: hypothetical protein KJO31_16010 [Gammaproteobacteria bacterium]|nr:hypothetical protein [Gammaproteobacteria bacterium]